MRCLAKKPSQRFATPKDVSDALENCTFDEGDTIRQEVAVADSVNAIGLHVELKISESGPGIPGRRF